jgi:hypothetical protein
LASDGYCGRVSATRLPIANIESGSAITNPYPTKKKEWCALRELSFEERNLLKSIT